MPVKLSFNRLLVRIILSSLALALTMQQISAQCSSSYFKNSTRKVVTNAFIGVETINDFNGDGKPDISSLDRVNNNFVVLLNNGAGGFSNPLLTFIGSSAQDFTVGDFNGDGKADLLFSRNTNPISVTTLTGNGNGTFTAWNTTTFNQFGPLYSKTVKFDADPRPQILAGNFYYQINSNGTLSPGNPISLPTDETGIHLGDFNGDGKTDFVYSGASNNIPTLILGLNQGNGSFAESIFNDDSIPVGLADLNNDGKDDILATARTATVDRKLIVFLSSASGTFTRVATNTVNGLVSRNVHVGDFNGDGIKDVLAPGGDGTATDPYHYTVYFGNGSGGFTEVTVNRGVPREDVYADFDGDGRTDFIGTAISYYFSTITFIVRKNVCSLSGQTSIVDFDGDGMTDLALWRPSDGRWSLNSNQTGAITRVFWGLGSLGDVPTPGDYDGDGKTDIAVWRNTNGVWYIRRSSDSNSQYIQWGATGDKPVQGDYDGDGIIDVAVYRPSNSVWYVLNSSNGSFRQVQFGIAQDKSVPADYDGDSKTDIAVYRPSTGTWYIINSSNGQFYARQFGISEDKPAPGDYDGDGKADLVVFRPSTSYWYLNSSVTGGYLGFKWGQNGDIATPISFNNYTQVTVYRPSEGRWYVNNGNTYDYFDFGGTDEIPVSSFLRIE